MTAYTYRELVFYYMGLASGIMVMLIPIIMRSIARVKRETEELDALIRKIDGRDKP